MSMNFVIELSGRNPFSDPLTELLSSGAPRLNEQAVKAEPAECMAQYQARRLDNGRAAVVRYGYHPKREIQTGIGPLKVKIPKVRAKRADAVSFQSARFGAALYP